jgi:adenylate kinase
VSARAHALVRRASRHHPRRPAPCITRQHAHSIPDALCLPPPPSSTQTQTKQLAASPHLIPARVSFHASPAASAPAPATTPSAAAAAAAAVSPETSTSAAAAAMFDQCWARLEAKYGNRLASPKEIVWLNGAPGSGKGANTSFILGARGLSRAVTMSALLEASPELKARIDAGDLLPDGLVCDALLDAIFNPDLADGAGVLIDGFPRTALQVDLLKALYDKMASLSREHAGTTSEWRFPRPAFKVVVLYVDEDESVRRQLARARLAAVHNARVLDAGAGGQLVQQRSSDVSPDVARKRYAIFKLHYSTILRLKHFHAFSLIDAMGTLDETRAQIARELRYQSSLELAEPTYRAIRHLPLAADLVREARQALVASLDRAHARHTRLFSRVVGVLEAEVLPLLKRCALAGHAEWTTPNPLFAAPLAQKILIDVLTDRGFAVSYTARETTTPVKVDLRSGAIESDHRVLHCFRLAFERAAVRDPTATALPLPPVTDAGGSVIGGTEVPGHLDAGVRDTRTSVNGGGGGSGGGPRSSLHDPVLGDEPVNGGGHAPAVGA